MEYYDFRNKITNYEGFDVRREIRLDPENYQPIYATIVTYHDSSCFTIDDSQVERLVLSSMLGTQAYKGAFLETLQLAIEYARTPIIDRNLKNTKVNEG